MSIPEFDELTDAQMAEADEVLQAMYESQPLRWTSEIQR